MDLGLVSLIISSITAFGTIVTALHIKKCHSGCIDSECFKPAGVPPSPPIKDPPKFSTSTI